MDLLCFCSVLCLLCLCSRLFICALWSPAGKGLTSWLSFVVSTVSLSLSHWCPWPDVVLDCIDSLSLHPYLLSVTLKAPTGHYQLCVYFTFCFKFAGLLVNSALLLILTLKYCHQSLIMKIIILSNHIDL